MIEKEDWRLTGGEESISGQKFKKIQFPDFWRKSYDEKNDFYQKVLKDAHRFVKEFNRGKEFLEGDKVQAFWHEHCYFCFEKFMTDTVAECYCTHDYNVWICKTCFEDFKEKFNLILDDN